MFINTSQISMDASTGHKDVSITSSNQTLSRNHAGRKDKSFTFNLPFLEQGFSDDTRTRLKGGQQTRSAVVTEDLLRNNYTTDQVISTILDGLTGLKNSVNRASPEFPAFRPLPDEQLTRGAQKRYYRIGSQQFSMSFASHRVHYEYEFLDFNSHGTVNTADGRSINFSLDLSVQRTQIIRQSVLGRAAAGFFVDPLVLHFDSGLESLCEQSFLFDLDGDDELDLLPGLKPGSGFLALDLDGDSRITSGRELFGPRSGSGFADLAVHDLDENRWIDENDPIFSKLLVWMTGDDGQQKLMSLEEAGVGAISLTNAGSQFNLKSPADVLLGQVAASGIFLTEAGEVKSIQDLNLAIQEKHPEKEEAVSAAQGSEIDRALFALRTVIAAQRRQMASIADRLQAHRIREHEHEEDLRWKFWKWQQEDNWDLSV